MVRPRAAVMPEDSAALDLPTTGSPRAAPPPPRKRRLPRGESLLPGLPAAAAAVSDLRRLARACGFASLSLSGYAWPWCIAHPHPGPAGTAYRALADANGRIPPLDATILEIDAFHGGVLRGLCASEPDALALAGGAVATRQEALEQRGETLRAALVDLGLGRFFIEVERFADDELGGFTLALEFHVEADDHPPSAHERLDAELAARSSWTHAAALLDALAAGS